MLVQIKDAKIPFYDKLPKDHQFYKHYMQGLSHNRMSEAAKQKAEQDRAMFEMAAETMQMDQEKAQRFQSPGGTLSRRIPYE